jgi:hypothetical protein
MSMAVRLKLNEALEATKSSENPDGITKNALAREAKVRPNLIYEMCFSESDSNEQSSEEKKPKTKPTKRIDLDTLSTIISALNRLSGKKHTISDILEYVEEE